MLLLREMTDFENFKVLTESKNGKTDLCIEGIFAQSQKKNKNGRFYSKPIMESAVNKYNTDWVLRSRAMGELTHPSNRPMVDPKEASHLITKFQMEGNDVFGKAKILNTPNGNIVKGLLEGGVKLGVSTRGLGSLVERADAKYVQNDFMLTAVDIVTDPSAPDAWVDAINEGVEWVYLDGKFVEKDIIEAKSIIQSSTTKKLDEIKLSLFENFLYRIK